MPHLAEPPARLETSQARQSAPVLWLRSAGARAWLAVGSHDVAGGPMRWMAQRARYKEACNASTVRFVAPWFRPAKASPAATARTSAGGSFTSARPPVR